jgi:hypothetical protein
LNHALQKQQPGNFKAQQNKQEQNFLSFFKLFINTRINNKIAAEFSESLISVSTIHCAIEAIISL